MKIAQIPYASVKKLKCSHAHPENESKTVTFFHPGLYLGIQFQGSLFSSPQDSFESCSLYPSIVSGVAAHYFALTLSVYTPSILKKIHKTRYDLGSHLGSSPGSPRHSPVEQALASNSLGRVIYHSKALLPIPLADSSDKKPQGSESNR